MKPVSFSDDFPSLENAGNYGMLNCDEYSVNHDIFYTQKAIANNCLDKQKVKETIEECTCQHTDKVVWKKKLLKELGLEGD